MSSRRQVRLYTSEFPTCKLVPFRPTRQRLSKIPIDDPSCASEIGEETATASRYIGIDGERFDLGRTTRVAIPLEVNTHD
jgi:hypothetical protein